MKNSTLKTSHGEISIVESDATGPEATGPQVTGPVVLMIHGNSSCKEVFRNQYDGAIGQSYHCVAMDLPGHGASADAFDPGRSYNMPGYADAALEVMQLLGHARYAVLGWSLGGHIGFEMIARSDAISGLMISGSPPVDQDGEGAGAGFLESEHMHLASQAGFTDQEVDDFARSTCGVNAPFEPFLKQAVARCDGRSRKLMFDAFSAGVGVNHQQVATHSTIPLAIVNGEKDAFVNNDFIAGLSYDNLWEDKVYLLTDIGHAPFWEVPDQFDPYLDRFLASLG